MLDSFTDSLGDKPALGQVKFDSFCRLIFLSVEERENDGKRAKAEGWEIAAFKPCNLSMTTSRNAP